MRIVFSFLFFLVSITSCIGQQFSVLSWNIMNLGKSKTEDNLTKIAEIVSVADIICIQEVVAGYGGAQAVSKIVNALNQKSNIWDYSISAPTQSSTPNIKERYVYIWKKINLKLNENSNSNRFIKII